MYNIVDTDKNETTAKMGALIFFCMVGVPFPNAHDVVMQQVAPHTLTPNP